MAKSTCVITGGSRGIGLATALRFAQSGWNVVIGARSANSLRDAATQIEALGAACLSVAADLGSSDGAKRILADAVHRFGGVHALINNVGVAPLVLLAEMPDDGFRNAINVNVASVFFATREAWGPMKSSGGGTIVNISSVASIDAFPGFSVYGACKAWVNAFTRAAAEEGRPLGIRVFAVAPGAVETDMLRGAFPDYPADQCLAPADVANVVFSLCQDDMRHASGQTVFVRK